MLAKKLRGFEDCDAPKLYRHFVSGKGIVEVQENNVNIIYPKRAHNPILRQSLKQIVDHKKVCRRLSTLATCVPWKLDIQSAGGSSNN